MKKKLYWIMSLASLTLFTAYAAAGLLGFGASTAYADAITEGGMIKMSKNFVVVNEDQSDEEGQPLGGIGQAFQSGEVICSLTPTQAAELAAFFDVHTFTVGVQGSAVQVATVSGRHLTKQELMNFLRASNQSLDCQIVGVHHLFFLPIIPQIS